MAAVILIGICGSDRSDSILGIESTGSARATWIPWPDD